MSKNWKNEFFQIPLVVYINTDTVYQLTVYQHRQKCFKIGWDINRNIFLLKGKCLFLRLYAYITTYAMDGICISCIIKFLYLGFTIIYAMDGMFQAQYG